MGTQAVTRVAFDSNVLLYAELEPQTGKGARARDLILRGFADGVIAAQAIAEFVNVTRAKASLAQGVAQAKLYEQDYRTPATTVDVVLAAANLVSAHRLQMRDAIIVAASAKAGASHLFSEDMQDGRTVGGVRLVNPFDPANNALVDSLI
jgi:predicted nucleic acid-binding protein